MTHHSLSSISKTYSFTPPPCLPIWSQAQRFPKTVSHLSPLVGGNKGWHAADQVHLFWCVLSFDIWAFLLKLYDRASLSESVRMLGDILASVTDKVEGQDLVQSGLCSKFLWCSCLCPSSPATSGCSSFRNKMNLDNTADRVRRKGLLPPLALSTEKKNFLYQHLLENIPISGPIPIVQGMSYTGWL